MKKIVWLFILIAITIVFIKYGRSIYIPILNKFKMKETISSVNKKNEIGVQERLKNRFTRLPSEILIVVLKEERVIDVYGKKNGELNFIKEYNFTAFSGSLGPKLKEGDKQIPEGIYRIEYLNPNSSYYLSMKINYPNEFDKEKAKSDNRDNLGYDIFIHGKNMTIGCIPIGDESIEELFYLSSKTIDKGIKVIISPRDFRINKKYPVIDDIEWEKELYDRIYLELKDIPLRKK